MRATPAQIPAADPERAPRLPARVPDHELLRRIGRGAYGEVWLARSITGAFRAVKVVHRVSFDHDRPFEREFQGILQFEPISRTHDSQVDILHVGRGDGCFYCVMELADDQVTGGQILADDYVPRTLKSDLACRGRLPFEECVGIGIALATALEHLHAHGLVHRDVKPSNIIFINGVPELADIGLVTSVDATRSHVGTEGFAAPEGPGTPRADLYSLGKVLYEMATGKDRQEFPGLPTSLRELPDREGLVELNAVIARACRHDPNDRYVSAAALRADLELLQSGKSLARLHRAQARLRTAERIGAVVATLAVLVAGGWLWQAGQTRQVRDLAAERSRLVGETTRLADENRERVVRLNVANGIREMDRRDLATALVWLGEALALATNNPADAALQRIRLQHLLAGHPRLLHVLPHPAGATAAEFAPDEQRLATGCADGSVRIWDTARDDVPVATFPSPGGIQRLRYTRDGGRLWVEWLDTGVALRGAALVHAATGVPVFPPVTEVTGTELSPDDRWLAVARADGTVQFLATDSGEVMAEAVGHSARVEGMRFSPDARQLLTASQDRTVRRWDVATGRPLGPRLLHDLPVAQAVWSRDATRVASVTLGEEASERIRFQTWDPEQAAAWLGPLPGRGPRAALAFNGSGRRLVTADREAAVRIWDADSHAMVAPPLALNSPVRCLEVSPDGAQVALGSEAGVVEVWDLETGQPALPPLHNAGRVESVRYNRDGSRLLTASDDGTVKVWDLALAPADRSLQLLSHQHPAAAVSPDGRHLLLGVADVPARLHSVALPALEASEPALPFATNFSLGGVVTFDASGRQWATAYDPEPYFHREGPRGGGGPTVAGLWRREAGGIRHFSLPHPSQVVGAFFHRDGRQLLTVGWDGLTRIWNTEDGTLQQTVPRPSSDAAWIAVSPDLRVAVAVCQEAGGWHVVFREVPTGKRLGGPAKDHPDITTAGFNPDGTRVATAGADQQGRIWDARSGERCAPAFKHGGLLTCIEWSPDGRRVLTAGESPEVKVWDATTGLLVLPPLRMKNRPVERARFSADGRFIVARSDEDLVRVWDAATGEPVTPFLPHTDTIRHVFVTATPQLITIQNCGMIRAWDLSPTPVAVPELVEFARLLAGGPAETNRSAGAHAAYLASSLRGLRSRRPEWFARRVDEIAEWHRRAAREPSTLVQAASAIFHLERLAELAPGDPTIPPRLDRWRGLLIPPRDSATPPQLLDLTRAYTRSFDLLLRREFEELPRGRHTLDGTEFDLRGIVHLDRRAEPADAVGPFHPLAVIRVGRRCQRLHFLQATEGEPRVDGSVVAHWIMHYADGSIREWPVIYGTHVRDAWWWKHRESAEATHARVAWNGRAVGWNRPELGGVRLFKATWTNSQPDLEITRLEFRMGETALKPFVVAITAE